MPYDVLIIGGGLVGASLAIALKNSGLSILVVEANVSAKLQSDDFDARSIALSHASKTILEGIGVWGNLKKSATPIETIHVSKQSQYGRTLLKAQEHAKEAFGFVAEMAHLNQAFQPMLEAQGNVEYWENARLKTLECEEDKAAVACIEKAGECITVSALLVVAADGTHSSVRSMLGMENDAKVYQQSAVVANIGLRRPHKQCAYERFTATGLIALLPMRRQRSALVWAMGSEDAKRIYALSDSDFLNELQNAFGYRLGRFIQVGRRGQFPLALTHMPKRTACRVAFIGNASQTLHPVAGQGFNLGLRDAAMLAELIHEEKTLLNPAAFLAHYESARQVDRDKIMKSTDYLVDFFALNGCVFNALQSAGLLLIDGLPILNKPLVQQAMGYSAQNSKLSCGIPFANEDACSEF